jgi:uncharacterized protein YndB with AHSA1/START domain
VISGEYLEVNEQKQLVYTWNWDIPNDAIKNAAYKLTVEFSGSDGNSTLKVRQENFQDEETMKPHREGWDKGLADLEEYLSGGSQSKGTGQVQSVVDTGNGGYRENPEQVKVGGE